MGKASKWIRNFLMGKKEEKERNDRALSIRCQATTSNKNGSLPGTPKVKRRWSFGKFVGKEATHKFSKSFDSIDATKLPNQHSSSESETLQNHIKTLAIVKAHVENAAATKIQAIFRSYLARKALHALRGLVKLQALVRGHIVRKKTAATLMQMHALMSIQVRARVQRLQMADEAQLVVRSHSSMQNSFAHGRGNIKPNETQLVSKSSIDYLNHPEVERMNTILHSGNLSISKRREYEEYCFTPQETSPRIFSSMSRTNPTAASFTHQQPDDPNYISFDYPLNPNYMTNTQSSRAKFRSQSEPKQRPKWNARQKSKQTELTDEMCVPLDDHIIKRSSSQCKFDGGESYDPWSVKLYRTGRSHKNSSKCDSISTVNSPSNYCESLAGYEPTFNLY
ncbi:hypothetical protein UlMin_029413 [Ulmus minor]